MTKSGLLFTAPIFSFPLSFIEESQILHVIQLNLWEVIEDVTQTEQQDVKKSPALIHKHNLSMIATDKQAMSTKKLNSVIHSKTVCRV